jgi:putative hydrolase of the HAD superfamily
MKYDYSIKVILFSSGGVLNYPVTGHWFIPPNFFQIINEKAYDKFHDIELDAAFSQAAEVLLNHKLIKSEEEEYSLFLEYYQTFFAYLPRLKATKKQIEQVAHDLVYNPDKYAFFMDASNIIPALAENYKLAIVSDAWPSLEDVLIKAGLHQNFSAFILSSAIGASLSDVRMYETALKELNVDPREALFVGDNKKNCDAAQRLGIQTALLCRDTTIYVYYRLTCRSHRVIQSLDELPRCLSGKP